MSLAAVRLHAHLLSGKTGFRNEVRYIVRETT
jgi:hypothetical protein